MGCALALPSAAHDDGSFGACVEEHKAACEDLVRGDLMRLFATVLEQCAKQAAADEEETETDETKTEQ